MNQTGFSGPATKEDENYLAREKKLEFEKKHGFREANKVIDDEDGDLYKEELKNKEKEKEKKKKDYDDSSDSSDDSVATRKKKDNE